MRGKKCDSPFTKWDNELCYPEYSKSDEEKKPFSFGIYDNITLYYSKGNSKLSGSITYTENAMNVEMNYGDGGYITYLSGSNEEEGRNMVKEMENGFIDKQTRAIAFSLLYYNKNSDLYSTVRIVFEFFPTDYLEKSAFLYTYELLTDMSLLYGFLRYGLIVVLALFTILFIYQEYINIITQRWSYITFWNAIVIAQIILLVLYICMFIPYCVYGGEIKNSLSSCYIESNNHDCFVDIFDKFIFFNNFSNVGAFLMLISLLKV